MEKREFQLEGGPACWVWHAHVAAVAAVAVNCPYPVLVASTPVARILGQRDVGPPNRLVSFILNKYAQVVKVKHLFVS